MELNVELFEIQTFSACESSCSGSSARERHSSGRTTKSTNRPIESSEHDAQRRAKVKRNRRADTGQRDTKQNNVTDRTKDTSATIDAHIAQTRFSDD